MLPVVVVACENQHCPAVGIPRRVVLRQTTPGVLERPVLVCARCLHEMAVTNTATSDEEGVNVAKTTVHGGPSNADDPDQVSVPDGGEYPSDEETGETVGEEVEPVDYNTWTVGDLRTELGRRGLSTTGVKAELVDRLTEDDQQPAADEG